MKDVREANVILGIKIRKIENGFSSSQTHYVEKLLRKFNSFNVAFAKTCIHLKKNGGTIISQLEYAKIIGSVMYIMNYTKPNITYVVSRLRIYAHNLNTDHWNAFLCLLKYLKDTLDWSLHFIKLLTVLEGFCDANWVLDKET
uniref:Retrovirus-related Pol polyprotein from transposon TNT 1-94 n=1 Tax=Cajanus cajan TaxID=3821 RepID=A0A151R8N3_CAJCA|nr:Retrovirus-related Pol polyprotein from transposon TNT 1-94 [Cajanus cajan]